MNHLITHVRDESFQKDVLESDLPVILDFWAPWCGPCKAIAPMLDRLAKEHEGALRIAKYDVDQSEQSRDRYGIRGVPTLIAYRHGKEVLRTTGVSPSSMQSILNAALFESRKPEAPVLSFKGDAQLKQTALAVLREANFRKTDEDGEQAFHMPTALLSKHFGADYGQALGLAPFVGILHDGLFEIGMDNGGDHAIATRWLDAIPVGQPMDAVLPTLVRAVLHDPELGFFPGVVQRVELPPVKSFLTDLMHLQAQNAGETPWSDMRHRLEMLSIELKGTQDAYLISILHNLAKPLERYTALDLTDVLPMTISFSMETLQEPYSPEDEKTLEILQARLELIHDEDVPQDLDDAAQKVWGAQQHARGDALIQAFWQEHPMVEQRVRERDERLQHAYQKRTLAMLDMLLDIVQRAGSAQA